MLLSFMPNDRPYCRVYNYCNKPSVLPCIHQWRRSIQENKQWHWWLMRTLRCSHLKATKPWVSFFLFFSCALSFQCHWLLYVRYKKQCMVNEAHNGQIWLTCQCRRVKRRRGVREEGGSGGLGKGRGRWGDWRRRKKEKKEGKRDR